MLRKLTSMMAAAFSPHFRVNAVAPGAILPPEGRGMDYLRKKGRGTPLARHGSPSEISDAVLFFLGNTYVTGQVLHVDGGAVLTAG